MHALAYLRLKPFPRRLFVALLDLAPIGKNKPDLTLKIPLVKYRIKCSERTRKLQTTADFIRQTSVYT